jgi:hypothetical protein
MAGKALVINVKIDGLRETMRAFRGLPKDASAELRDAAGEIADDMVGWIRNAAENDSAQSALMAGTVKVVRDRVPAITVGGSTRVGRNRAPAYKILFGANFGSRSMRQFRPWAGQGQDYFIFSNIEGHAKEIEARWLDAADKIIDRWVHSEGV